MPVHQPWTSDTARRTCWLYLGLLFGVVCVLGLLHVFLADLKVGGVRWFHLDKERNIPTWFSGMLFFLMGCAAFVAYTWERTRNGQAERYFRLPFLWLGIGFVGLFMSLDEITILHENLFWRETRQLSAQYSDVWKYVTQWQLLFAPAIVLILGYFVLFFANRFSVSPHARWSAFSGIGCWVGALLLEGVRGTFKQAGAEWYSFQVLLEETLEMAGAICLLASIVFYSIDIALDFTTERRERLQFATRFLTTHAVVALGMTFLGLSLAGGAAYFFAQQQAVAGAPLSRLYEKALASQPQVDGETLSASSSLSPIAPIAVPEVWFDDMRAPLSLTDADGEALLRFIGAAIAQPGGMAADLPVALREDSVPRIVFLSVSDGATPASVVIGAGKGVMQAVERAISQVQQVQKRSEQTSRPTWLKFDIVQEVRTLPRVNRRRPLAIDRSLHGIAFDRQSGVAFLPEELVAYTLVNSKHRIRRSNIAAYLQTRSQMHSFDTRQFPQLGSANRLTLFRFTTHGFFTDGKEVVRLYRGHRVFSQISREALLSAARRGGQYLTRAVAPDGTFVYAYRPKTDEVREKYNILRHAGTVYAMLELYEVTGDTALLQAAQRALEYLLLVTLPCPAATPTARCVVEDGEVKLGGNALAAIALVKFIAVTGDRQHLPAVQQLGTWIQNVQDDTGRFRVHKQTYPEGAVSDFVSQYYPGEALLALVRIYALDPRESWLDKAENGAQWLINVRDKGVPVKQLNHDHWLLYALNELYRHRPKPVYLKHASRIADAIVQSQNRQPRYPDWLGSYYRPPRSTPTATRSEGLYAAYQLLRDFDQAQEVANILEALRLGIAFQLQTQFRPESVLYVQDPQRALGGFRRSLTNYEIRIDYVQHNISSLLGLYHLLRDKQ